MYLATKYTRKRGDDQEAIGAGVGFIVLHSVLGNREQSVASCNPLTYFLLGNRLEATRTI